MEVPEHYRRHGIARALLQAVEAEAARRGHRKVFLSVAVGNTAARALYENDGFVDTGLRRVTPQFDRSPGGTYGEPVRKEMEFMVKDLSQGI
jgi:ribosomal protein S18 acetylase RimI-like enzyme